MDTIQKRSCGGCTACCKTHPVREIAKPYGEWCEWCAIGQGCTRYDNRPRGCRDFACQWLQGSWREEDRPDKTRIVTDFVHYPSIGDTLILFELSNGRLDGRFAASLRHAALESGYALLLIPVVGSVTLLVRHNVKAESGQQMVLEDGRTVRVIYV